MVLKPVELIPRRKQLLCFSRKHSISLSLSLSHTHTLLKYETRLLVEHVYISKASRLLLAYSPGSY